jgi:O-6-methylguanine DNA methyltransferase
MTYETLKTKWFKPSKSLKASGDVKKFRLSKISSPLGPLLLGSTEKGLSLIDYYSFEKANRSLEEISKIENFNFKFEKDEFHLKAIKQLDEYFLKKRQKFDLPLDVIGTEFQKKVWKVLTKIPYGSVYSYSLQAELLGKPKAIRALASANGRNKISIVLPCHRVIGKDGGLRGYAGGLDKKKWLLDHEKTRTL